MVTTLLAAVTLPFALQSSDAAPTPPVTPALTSLAQLPIEESVGPRCAVAFAIVGRWQRAGDARGAEYPDMENEGGREFFVRSMATLMERHNLSREAASSLIGREAQTLASPQGAEQIEAMMPSCLLLLDAAGL